jgi:hypothetical protein
MTVTDFPLFARVERPSWRSDPAGAAFAYLQANPRVYPEFRRLADDWRERNPGRHLSADMIAHVIRFQTPVTEADAFKINNSVTPLLGRLYLLERPEASLEVRHSHLDSLHSGMWGRLLATACGGYS